MHGLARKTFDWWAWRLGRECRSTEPEQEGGRFLPVEVAALPTTAAAPDAVPPEPEDDRIEITLPDGLAVRVGRDFDAAALRRVLTVLGR
nr:hypothetical protein [Azospirillum brasilense]